MSAAVVRGRDIRHADHLSPRVARDRLALRATECAKVEHLAVLPQEGMVKIRAVGAVPWRVCLADDLSCLVDCYCPAARPAECARSWICQPNWKRLSSIRSSAQASELSMSASLSGCVKNGE